MMIPLAVLSVPTWYPGLFANLSVTDSSGSTTESPMGSTVTIAVVLVLPAANVTVPLLAVKLVAPEVE